MKLFINSLTISIFLCVNSQTSFYLFLVGIKKSAFIICDDICENYSPKSYPSVQ